MVLSELVKEEKCLDADGMITIYEIESGQTIIALEGLEIWEMIQSAPDYPYLPDSGRCIGCMADTLWGDAPHKEDCKIIEDYKERVERIENDRQRR